VVYRGSVAGMGRPGRLTSGRTSLNLDPDLKRRAMFYALRHNLTLTDLIEQALRRYLSGGQTKTPPQREPERGRESDRD
jgi:hypothetical protein